MFKLADYFHGKYKNKEATGSKHPAGTNKWNAAIVFAGSFTCWTQQNVCRGKGHFDKDTARCQTSSFSLWRAAISCHIYLVCEYIYIITEFESNLSFPTCEFPVTLRVHVGMEKTSYTYSLDVEVDFTGVNLGM